MSGEPNYYRDALDRIRKVCDNSREQTRRIRWIRKRCHNALEGIPYKVEDFDLPRAAGDTVATAKAKAAALQRENDELRAEIARLEAEVERQMNYRTN